MVSVCITTYNGEKFVGDLLRSILPQLGAEDEIIISDDGSKDETLSIIESFVDARIRVQHHVRQQEKVKWDCVTHNFEHALQYVRGDVIFLCDQDDKWLPNRVSKMTAALRAPFSLAICDAVVCDDKLAPLHPSMFGLEPITQTYWDALTHFRMLGCCMAFRRELLDYVLPFPASKVGHDLWIWLMAKHYGHIVLVRKPLHLYRRHANSVSTAGQKTQYSLAFRIYYRLFIVTAFIKRVLTIHP